MTDTDRIRTTTLTLLGALGYLAFLALVALKALGEPVSWQLLGVVLLTSSGLLGVDFGLDVFSLLGRPPRNAENPRNEDDNR